MNDKKLESIKTTIEKSVRAVFGLFVSLVNIMITVFLLFGAIAAILLVYKMFPELALTILEPMFTVFSVLADILWICAAIMCVLLWGYIVVRLTEIFRDNRKKREKNRKKFIDDLSKKLKKELKNK